MRTPVSLAWVLSAFVLAPPLVACGGGDPGTGGASDDAGGPSLVAPGDPSSGHASSGATPDAGHGSSTPDSGVATPVTLPTDTGTFVPNPTNAFSGAGNYASNPPSIRANDFHPSPVTGKPCLDCHDGSGSSVKFDFAGTVWQAPARTKGAADVEVRIIDANSYAHDVHSDVDGNFWHAATKDLPLPAFSGVRTSAWKAVGTLNGTSCNHCHNTSNDPPGRLFVD